MPKLADSVSRLKIGNKTFQNPEWWSTQHKLKRMTKYNDFIKGVAKKANYRTTLNVVTLERQPSIDEYIYQAKSNMDLDCYTEYTPWNTSYRKSKTIITFSK